MSRSPPSLSSCAAAGLEPPLGQLLSLMPPRAGARGGAALPKLQQGAGDHGEAQHLYILLSPGSACKAALKKACTRTQSSATESSTAPGRTSPSDTLRSRARYLAVRRDERGPLILSGSSQTGRRDERNSAGRDPAFWRRRDHSEDAVCAIESEGKRRALAHRT